MKRLDKLSAAEMRKILEDLINDAQTIDRNEDSVFEDDRDMAEYATREIVETLLDLTREADAATPKSTAATETKTTNLLAYEESDGEIISFSLILEAFAEPALTDVVEAAKEAAREFLTTEEGLELYAYNCGCFNWDDFQNHIPGKICNKYGFRIGSSDVIERYVDLNEQIAKPVFLVSHIEWDVDDDDGAGLPDEFYVPLEDLLDDGEELGEVEVDKLKDRIANYLSDECGFCVKSFSVS